MADQKPKVEKKSKKKTQKGTHIASVFGDPKKLLKELSKSSLAIKSLPQDLKEKLVEVLAKLPMPKQIEALQLLQKEQGAYYNMAVKEKKIGINLVEDIKTIKVDYIKKKNEIIREGEKRQIQKNIKQK
jgi:hypothetical protein